MYKFKNFVIAVLLVAGLSSCGSEEKYFIKLTVDGTEVKEGDKDIGWSSSGGNTSAFFGFGKNEKGNLKIMDISDALKEAASVDEVVGKSFPIEATVGDLTTDEGSTCNITSFEAQEGSTHSDMFGDEYLMKGDISGTAGGKEITEGKFSIKVYKKKE